MFTILDKFFLFLKSQLLHFNNFLPPISVLNQLKNTQNSKPPAILFLSDENCPKYNAYKYITHRVCTSKNENRLTNLAVKREMQNEVCAQKWLLLVLNFIFASIKFDCR